MLSNYLAVTTSLALPGALAVAGSGNMHFIVTIGLGHHQRLQALSVILRQYSYKTLGDPNL